jgi:hypothetical protein
LDKCPRLLFVFKPGLNDLWEQRFQDYARSFVITATIIITTDTVTSIFSAYNTALMLAVKKHRFGMVQVLLDAKADCMLPAVPDADNMTTPLHMAVGLDNAVIAKMLLNAGAHVSCQLSFQKLLRCFLWNGIS